MFPLVNPYPKTNVRDWVPVKNYMKVFQSLILGGGWGIDFSKNNWLSARYWSSSLR